MNYRKPLRYEKPRTYGFHFDERAHYWHGELGYYKVFAANISTSQFEPIDRQESIPGRINFGKLRIIGFHICHHSQRGFLGDSGGSSMKLEVGTFAARLILTA